MRPEESLAKMVASLSKTTGKSIEEWRGILAERGIEKHGEVMQVLKGEFGLSHGYANQIALNRVPKAEVSPFANRAFAEGIYDALMVQINAFGPDIDVAAKKAYVSIRRKTQFAICQPAADRLDVGIKLLSVEATPRLELSGSFNSMLSHRVRVKSVSEIDEELLTWLRTAYSIA